jgi:hypothetical protein
VGGGGGGIEATMISYKASYRVWLRDPRWKKLRQRILARDGWQCQQCGRETPALQVHHLRSTHDQRPWETHDQDLLTVCSFCHGEQHMASGTSTGVQTLQAPHVIQETQIQLQDFSLLLAKADNGKSYMERHEWEHVAHLHDAKKRPGYMIWTEFLWPGDAASPGGNGDRLRKDLEHTFGPGSDLHVQFTDEQGRAWLVIELAMAFAAHINPALKVRMLEVFRQYGLNIFYDGESPRMDLETITDEHKYHLMMKWHTEALQKMSAEMTVVKETALQAETKATDALLKADLALDNAKWFSVEEWVVGEQLLRKFPQNTWRNISDKLSEYCSLYNIEVKKFPVKGKQWDQEKFFPPAAFSWLLRQKHFIQKTMGW